MAFVTPRSFEINDKRQRVVTTNRAKRPIDKVITVVDEDYVAATLQNLIHTQTYPGTMTGLRWNFSLAQTTGTAFARFIWAIVYLRDGDTLDDLTFTTGAVLYKPEQNCLVWGFEIISNNSETKHIEGTTKTMRKMMVGDQIIFLGLGTAGNNMSLNGAVQLFIKG